MAVRTRRLTLLAAVCAVLWSVPASPAQALPLFSFSSTTLSFPSTAVGDTSAGISVVVTNVSGSSQVLSSVAGGAPGDPNFDGVQNCAGVTLLAGASCAITYTFVPTSSGPHSTTTSFTVNGEASGTISMSGTATPGFSISPTALSFASTAVGGASASIPVVVTNLATSAQTVSAAGGAPSDPNFNGVQNCVGVTLAGGASCSFTYTFVPTTVGAHSATTSVTINGQSSGTISMTGTATPGFSIAPTSLTFATTDVGSTSPAIGVVVTNLANQPQTISAAGGAPGDANFDGVQNCAGVTLAPGATCAFTYSFTPQTAGLHTATTSVTINGQSSGTITLTGATPGATVSPTPTASASATASAGAVAAGLADTGSAIGPWAPVGVVLLIGVGGWLVLRAHRVPQRVRIRRR